MTTTTVIHVIKSNIWPLPGYSLLQDLKRKCKKKKILKPPDVAVVICITDYMHMSPREISLIFLPKYLLLLTDHINVRTSCKTLYMMCKNVYFQCFSLPEQFLLSVGYFFFSFLIPMASLLIFLFSQLDSAFLLRCWLTINITLTMLTIYCILVMIFLFGQIMLELLEIALFFFPASVHS